MEKKEYDLLSGILFLVLGIYVIYSSIGMARDVGGDFSQSPGMMPGVLGAGLIIAALTLTVRSFKACGGAASFRLLANSLRTLITSPQLREYVVAIVPLAIFTFLLLPRMPFWISAFIFMVGTMFLTRATSWWKILLISVFVVGGVQLVFQVFFRVPLPS